MIEVIIQAIAASDATFVLGEGHAELAQVAKGIDGLPIGLLAPA